MLYGSLRNRLMENMVGRPAPERGDGATIIMHSDRHPVTIIAVREDLVITQRDNVTGDTSKGELQMGHQDWIITRDLEGQVEVWKRAKDGRLLPYGERPSKRPGCVLVTGSHEAYHDWEF